jgi:Ca2+-binding RTX toxin-like protein
MTSGYQQMSSRSRIALFISGFAVTGLMSFGTAAFGHSLGWSDCADGCGTNDVWPGHEHYDAEDSDGNWDFIYGGQTGDYQDSGNGTDYVEGNDGSDEIHGSEDGDEIHGGAGNDSINGGGGYDVCYGGGGNDSFTGCEELH